MQSRLIKAHVRDWQEMAAIDPFRAISGQHKYWDIEEFFATAKPHMDQLFSVTAAVGLPKCFDRALDFGCGAGRFLPHLEKRFREIWGVDVAHHMIALARKHNPRCNFYVNTAADLEIFPAGHFDLVYSFLVLQHLPDKLIIARYLAEFIRILRDNGLAVFQIPDHLGMRWSIQPRRRIYHLLRAIGFGSERLQSWALLPMKFTAISKEMVLSVITAAGGKVVRIDELGSPEGLMYYCTR
jgi:SAM-dependent methyltransferase